MVREYDDQRGLVAPSSIALLQERFRQLERMKELRHEKELLRLLSELERQNPHKQKARCQLSLSLWTDSQAKNTRFRRIDGTRSDRLKWWFSDAPVGVRTKKPLMVESSSCDVDTSLRL